MGAQALQFLLHVGPCRQHSGLLVKAPFIEADTAFQQPPDLLLQPLADGVGGTRRRGRDRADQTLDGCDLAPLLLGKKIDWPERMIFSTFGGNAVAAAAGLAVLEVLDVERLMANAAATGSYLRDQLESVAARHACLGDVRGTGLLLGVDVLGGDGSPSRVRNKRIVNALASEFGILIGYEGPQASILKLRPPMPFRREHADLLVEAIDAAATAVDVS